MHVMTIGIPELGNLTHLVHDGYQALVVDPPRDVELVEEAAELAALQIAAVADTHVHHDYVSGAALLARRHGAPYLLSADERMERDRQPVQDGDVLDVGSLRVEVLATPGHTLHHQAFLVTGDSGPAALFTGGSLVPGSVGRTDLCDPLLVRHLARAQWSGVRALRRLDPDTTVHPSHGQGSRCVARGAVALGDTPLVLADEIARNPVFRLPREEFVEQLVAGFGPVPAHFPRLTRLNRGCTDTAPRPPGAALAVDDLHGVLSRGGWLVDLRDRAAYARGHLSGSVNIEYGASFATWLGWLKPSYAELALVSDSPEQLSCAVRDLDRIGIEGVPVHTLDPEPTLRPDPYHRRSTWAEHGTAPVGATLVDVRDAEEFELAHVPGAVHIALHQVEQRARDLPPGELWVYCHSGYRAGIAASLLHRAGRSVVHVDDSWDHAVSLSVPLTASRAA
ncbi:rhodanese-like domain-containing protein [Nocardioides sp. 616]|uniref:rhodanese-like domain-containing protein n=1 Tax=Nocardioides sp. 616 TaxID=2268090 RepID=UPI000DEEA3EC|nr:rhodanese-like domain-containing protein [Nocardioides sp. 616]